MATRYPVELPISFDGGTGVTRSVSREEVRFATSAPLSVGQVLTGTLCSPGGNDGIGTTLRFSAQVTGVRRPDGSDVLEVEARFERLGFAVLHAASSRDVAEPVPAWAWPSPSRA